MATRTDPATCRSRLEVVRSRAELRRQYIEAGLLNSESGPNAVTDDLGVPPIEWARQSVFVLEGGHDVAVRFVVSQGTTVTIGTQTCAASEVTQCEVKFRLVDVVLDVVKEHVCADLDCTGASSTQTTQ